MSTIGKFGEDVEGYRIPVLNEREIRAAAGILFVLMFAAIAAAVLEGSFVLLKYAIAIFLFCETAFGICIGCKLYPLVAREKPEYCPGEVCEVGDRQAIQRTSPSQLLMVLGLAAYVVLLVMLFHSRFGVKSHALFGS